MRSASVSGTPVDCTELTLAEEVSVKQAQGSHGLVSVGHVGIVRISLRSGVLERDGVGTLNSHGKRRISTEDPLRSIILGGGNITDIVFARR